MENLFFEYEIHFSRIFSIWKPRYSKLEYKVDIHDRILCLGFRAS